MDKTSAEVLRHLNELHENHKRDILAYFADIKLKIPSFLKSATIAELIKVGGSVDPDIVCPLNVKERLLAIKEVPIKKDNLIQKFKDIREEYVMNVKQHYENVRKQLTDQILKKTLSELEDEELDRLGIHSHLFKSMNKNRKMDIRVEN